MGRKGLGTMDNHEEKGLGTMDNHGEKRVGDHG